MRVAIVGGGITGLAAAYYLERLSDAEIVLFEPAERLGGKIDTERHGTYLIESSADSIFTRKSAAIELIRELGMGDALIEPLSREFSMLIGGKLWPVPANLLAFGRISPEVLAQVEFLSQEAKARILDEPNQPPAPSEDESIQSFFTRRYGAEYSQKIAEPLLAGTHSGLPDRLSMAALYPNLLRLEREFGSIAAGMKNAAAPPEISTFVTLREGLGSLPEAIAKALTRTSVRRQQVRRVDFSRVDDEPFGAIVLALPAPQAAPLVRRFDLQLAQELASFTAASGAIATLTLAGAASFEGTGFLVPFTEPFQISGVTWSSNKWPNRAPEGTQLVRVFLGREGVLDVAEHDDPTLIQIASQALANLFGPSLQVTEATLRRWPNALPQYNLGHRDRVASVKSRAPFHLAGQSYEGVGIPDCIAQGKRAAEQVARSLKV